MSRKPRPRFVVVRDLEGSPEDGYLTFAVVDRWAASAVVAWCGDEVVAEEVRARFETEGPYGG